MIPIPLLIALLLGFGVDVPARSPANVPEALACIGGAVLAVAGFAFAIGLSTAFRIRRTRFATARVRRTFLLGSRILPVATLTAYGLMIHAWGWPGVVLDAWGWDGSILVDDALILAPFLLMQVLGWWGMFYGERALIGLPAGHRSRRVARHLYLEGRASLGLVLPIILVFVARNDILGRLWPRWQVDPLFEAAEMAALGLLVLTASPLFIRLAWPTRSLPDGPLRRRLEAVSRRSGFRCADVLIWDTDRTLVNACVTGVLPRLRYVLLTDALIETLTPIEVAAVFGHEIGHVAHHHLRFTLFFSVGCLAVVTMASGAFLGLEAWLADLTTIDTSGWSTLRDLAEGLIAAAGVGVFTVLVFGALSRRFERQADLYACKAVSCDSPACPPHLEGSPGGIDRPIRGVCPTGVRIFADGLATVARKNGIDPEASSWRQDSVAGRIAFLESLADSPAREVAFQRDVQKVRRAVAFALAASLGLAGAAYWFGLGTA